MAKIRPLGDILLDLEPLLDEMQESHALQWGDILNLIFGHLQAHPHPNAQEIYEDDNSSPVFYYGPVKK